MRARFALPTLTLTLALVAALLPGVAQAHGKPECHPEVGRAVADPIVNHLQPASAHEHIFFGAKVISGHTPAQINALSYTEVSGQPTSCENVDDSAMYWAPTIYDNGQPLPIRRMIAYYRTFDYQKQGPAEPFPPGLQAVVRVTSWTCGQSSSRPGPFRSPQEAACHTAGGSVALTAHVDVPPCWDGQLNPKDGAGNTADFSNLHSVTNHLAYTSTGPGRHNGVCPAGFAHKLPGLRMTIGFVKPTSANLTSSDGGSDFRDYHADFWNTWVQTGGVHGGQVGFVQHCIVEAAPDHHSGANIEVCGF